MKHIQLFSAFTLIAINGIFAQNSCIQIVSEPGFSVFLNENFKGITSMESEGVVLENLPEGIYLLKFVKEGFDDIYYDITLADNETRVINIRQQTTKIKVRLPEDEVDGQKIKMHEGGNLKINSFPEKISIEIPSAGIKSTKSTASWVAENLPEGMYHVIFSSNGINLIDSFQISNLQETCVLADMVNNKVISLGRFDNLVFILVETMPEFPGGEKALYKFLKKNIQYPAEAKRKNIQGRVFVTFVVERDGTVDGAKILRGIGGGCDEEVLRIITLMPKWKPGETKGEPVRVQYNLPVKFTLTSTNSNKSEKK